MSAGRTGGSFDRCRLRKDATGSRRKTMSTQESPREPDLSLFLASKPTASSVDFVVNSIKELLLGKKVFPGDRLPPETELCRLLSVSRGSVREAMKILSALGIVEVKRGDGTYISTGSSEVMFDPLLFNLIVSQPEFAELKELRVILEKNVVRLAVLNATDDDLRLLRECVEKTESLKNKTEKKYDELLAFDLEFHAILSRAGKNRPLETIYRFVMQYFRPYIAQSLTKHSNFSSESSDVHRKILEAVEQRNVAAAEKAVEESMEVWELLIFKQ
jgi:DNA-binding FadR family transcriptional regulator